jgi:hypothetical protein
MMTSTVILDHLHSNLPWKLSIAQTHVTVRDLKCAIADEKGVPVDYQMISYRGVELDDETNLERDVLDKLQRAPSFSYPALLCFSDSQGSQQPTKHHSSFVSFLPADGDQGGDQKVMSDTPSNAIRLQLRANLSGGNEDQPDGCNCLCCYCDCKPICCFDCDDVKV